MPVVKINAISVPPEAHEELEKRFSNRAHTVDGSPGFLGFQLLRPVKGEDRYFVVTQWEDEESFAAWRDGPAIKAHSGERAKPVSSGADLLEFEVSGDQYIANSSRPAHLIARFARAFAKASPRRASVLVVSGLGDAPPSVS